ncbi:hypothetical protein [Bartonella rattaustraliani]|uniref:hypothetical protein n=1 Tax=Bartonella rattaustraliani TaxID=481139 RepID=UPI0002DF48E1|nr:hypothetical protein [Bartonella rattaustraliani]
MIKILKNYILSVFIALAFSFSQVVNVSANSLNNNSQKEKVSIFVIGSKKEKEIVASSVLDFACGTKNEVAIEKGIEKVVFEPISLGFFTTVGALGFGFLTGSVAAILSAIIGWAIGSLKST